MIALCTDSSALLPDRLAAALGVTIAPISVTLDGETFEDGVDLDVDLFYERIGRGVQATTSQPSPGRFALLYQEAVDAGATDVLSLHVAESLSGTVGSAEVGARTRNLPVTVVDTGTASFGVAICVLAAAEAIGDGGSLADVISRVRQVAARIGNVFVAADPTGGRLERVGGLPLLSFSGGQTRPVGAATDLNDAADAMARLITAQGEDLCVAVGHAAHATREPADALAAALAQAPAVRSVIRYRVGPSVGAHTGPLSFGAFWWAQR